MTPDTSGRTGAAAVRRVLTTGGMQRVVYDSLTKTWQGNVDDLYRFEQGRTALRPGARDTIDRAARFYDGNGEWNASSVGVRHERWSHQRVVRYPERRTTILVLTKDNTADAKGMAERIANKLFSK